ncbi:uncharacterized protein [Palaemon carinicauda]|uniref:uncharacterized protein n=1 Tax=Palaemon carinicauda TaxID=392227 RepID=UPI0035B6704D
MEQNTCDRERRNTFVGTSGVRGVLFEVCSSTTVNSRSPGGGRLQLKGKMKSLVLWFLCLGLASGLTWMEKYDVWASDLLPGYEIQTKFQNGQKCYCKVRVTTWSSSSSSSGQTTQETITETTFTTTTTSTTPTTTTTSTTPTTTTTSTTPTTTTTSTTPTTTTTSTTPTTTTTSTTPTTTTTSTTPTTTTTSTTPTTTTTSTTPTTTTTSTTPTTTTTTTTPTTTTTSTTPTTTTTTTTPTTTSTTTTTTTTTTTPTTTTTTTTPTTTTTIPTTTTTTRPPINCDLDITIRSGQTYYWQTPNYPANYPENISCKLIIRATGVYVTVSPESSVQIYYQSTTCATAPDRLVVQNPTTQNYCGSFTMGFTVNALFGSKTMTATFYSSSADGGTAKGFRYMITAF